MEKHTMAREGGRKGEEDLDRFQNRKRKTETSTIMARGGESAGGERMPCIQKTERKRRPKQARVRNIRSEKELASEEGWRKRSPLRVHP